MNLLFSFLDSEHSHSALLAGYFSKVPVSSKFFKIFVVSRYVLLSLKDSCFFRRTCVLFCFATAILSYKVLIYSGFPGSDLPFDAEDDFSYELYTSKSSNRQLPVLVGTLG